MQAIVRLFPLGIYARCGEVVAADLLVCRSRSADQEVCRHQECGSAALGFAHPQHIANIYDEPIMPGTALSPDRLPTALAVRSQAMRREALAEFERTAARESFWLTYTLLGWTNLLACAVSHYLVAVLNVQDYVPYLALWIVQIGLALGATSLVGSSWKTDHLPLLAQINRIGTIFVLLCWNVAALNVILGLPVFTLLPVLATLSSFTLLVLSMIASPRLLLAALVMFVTGSLMALFPEIGFLLYGLGWLVVLQTLGVIFFRKRCRGPHTGSGPDRRTAWSGAVPTPHCKA